MTVYGDLETSTLRQLPSGRGGVSSSVVPVREKPAWLDRAWARLREEVAAGRQAYVVCPRIGERDRPDDEPEDADGAAGRAGGDDRRPPLAVLDVAELLRDRAAAGLRLEVLHGRLTPEDKEARMRAFAAGEVDVLVATTVVEVGVDVPNATVMVVMDADRFGVSQLHQLRGRVGPRASTPGCACWSARRRPRRRPGSGWPRSPPPPTASSWPAWTSRPGARATSWAPRSPAAGRACGCCRCCEDEELIAEARAEATALVETERGLADHPGLAAEVAALATDERAEYLEKA